MLRSFLFVPAKENMLNKVGKLGADAYIIDLEDSIENSKKEEALILVESFLKEYDYENQVFVRLNNERVSIEAPKLHRFNQIGFMLPKFETIKQYNELSAIWQEHKVIALVETPLGIVNIHDTASCKWVDMLAFGAEDYTSATNMENSSELIMFQKGCLLTYAKAYGKYTLDTPSFIIDSEEIFEADVRLSVRMGFDGKLAISPKHVQCINESFLHLHIEEMREIISQYEDAGKAVQVIKGKVYEKMHINLLKRLIDKEK